jgi:hypothetical protein
VESKNFGNRQELRLHTAFTFQTEWIFQHQGAEAAAAFLAPITARCLGPEWMRLCACDEPHKVKVETWAEAIRV